MPESTLPAPSRRSRLKRRLSAVAAAGVACAAIAAVPGVANAQSLNTVALATDASAEFLVLDVSGGSTSAGAGVIQWYGNGGANQRWSFVQLADGNEQIVSENSGQCLTTNGQAGSQLYQWPCYGGAGQEWSGSLPTAWGGLQRGSALVNPWSGLAIDINGGSGNAGTAAIGWYYTNHYNQHFAYWQL